MAITPYLRLQKPPFDTIPWDAAVNGNMDIIDSFAAQFLSVPNFGGTWNNSTAYTTGQLILDPATATLWQCLVSHTSAAPPTTFGQDRTANPSYWLNEGTTPPVQMIQNTGRNLLHNGLFELSQLIGPWTAQGYTMDRWISQYGTGDSLTVQQVALPPGSMSIGDESYRFVMSTHVIGAGGAGNFALIAQRVENLRQLSGKTVAVSFYAATNVPGTKVGVNVEQNFGTGGSPSGYTITNGIAVTLGGPYTRYSVVFNLPSAAGKILGTNNDDFTQLNLWLSSGSDDAMRSGGVGIQSAVVNFWGVQLEIGNVVSPLDKPTLAEDRINCQRFLQTGGTLQLYGWQGAGDLVAVSNALPVTMRVTPYVSFAVVSAVNITSPSVQMISAATVNMSGTATATGPFTLQCNYTLSAEL